MNDEADRFSEVKRLEQEGGDHDMPSLVNPLPAERPMGAQHVAVKRKTSAVLAEIRALAAAAGEAWYYRWPVKSKNDDSSSSTKWIEGPSIKLANDLARVYGNCHVDVRVIENDTSWFFYAMFTDLETGFSMTRPFQQRKNQKSIRGSDDRQRDIAFQIGASKAIRNIVVNALQTYADYGFEEARNSLIEKIGKNLEGSRERLGQLISESRVEPERIERVVGRTIKEMLAPDIARVRAMLKAIDDGMASVNETFPYQAEQVNPLANDPAPAYQGGIGTQSYPEEMTPQANRTRQEPVQETKAPEPPKPTRTRKARQEPTATPVEVKKPEPSPVETGAVHAHKIQLHTGEVVELTAAEVIWGKGQGWDIVQTAKHFLEQDKAAEIGTAEPETETRDTAAQQDQEAREAASRNPSRQLADETAAAISAAPTAGDGIPGFLDRSGFVAEATTYIGQFKGSAGSLLDWWRSRAKDRAKLALEDQTRLSQLYTAKFNALNSESPL